MAGFTFGSLNPGSNPTTSGGSLFGNRPNAPSPGFGLGGNTNTTSSLFGGTGTQPTFGSSTFGSAALQPSTGLFGAPAASTAASGMFGSPAFTAQTAAAPAFGQPFGASTSGGSLTYGQPAVSSSLAGITLGPAATQSSAGLFGSPAKTSVGFGAPTTSVATTTPVFGCTPPGYNFGAPIASAASAFTPGTSLGFQGFTAPATSAAKPLSLNFSATTIASSAGLGLPYTAANTQASAFNMPSTGLFGSLSKPLGLGLGTLPTTSAAVAPSQGLGGIDTSQSRASQAGLGAGRSDNLKENQIPNEIIQTIESFKSFVKEQKSCSSDIARGSTKSLDKVREDGESLKQMLCKLRTTLHKYRAQTDHLKCETAGEMRHAEMAQRTHDTPPGLQYDNTAPLHYFVQLVATFELEMQVFRQEIEHTEKHIKSLIEPRPLTPQELTTAMRRLHDSFVALAGRLQTVHNNVQLQKDQYLNLRKYFLKDASDVFDTAAAKRPGFPPGHFPMSDDMAVGPTPFTASNVQHGYGLHSSGGTDSTQIYPPGNPTGWGGGNALQATTYNAGMTSNVVGVGDSNAFVLQKPPPGTKRGKR